MIPDGLEVLQDSVGVFGGVGTAHPEVEDHGVVFNVLLGSVRLR